MKSEYPNYENWHECPSTSKNTMSYCLYCKYEHSGQVLTECICILDHQTNYSLLFTLIIIPFGFDTFINTIHQSCISLILKIIISIPIDYMLTYRSKIKHKLRLTKMHYLNLNINPWYKNWQKCDFTIQLEVNNLRSIKP